MSRRASSLVEVLVSVSLTGLVLVSVAQLSGTLFREQRQWTASAAAARQAERLSLALRRDARQAVSLEAIRAPAPAGAAGQGVWLQLADGREIGYQIEPRGFTRLVRAEGHVVHRDAFHFPDPLRAAFEFDDPAGRLLALRWEPAVDVGVRPAGRGASRIVVALAGPPAGDANDMRDSNDTRNAEEATP